MQSQSKRTRDQSSPNRGIRPKGAMPAFTRYERIPFANGGVERDLRVTPGKHPVAGIFRASRNVPESTRTHDFIHTTQEPRQSLLRQLINTFTSFPLLPPIPLPT